MKRLFILATMLSSISFASVAGSIKATAPLAKKSHSIVGNPGKNPKLVSTAKSKNEIYCGGGMEVCPGHYHVFCWEDIEDLMFELEMCIAEDCS